MGKLKREIVRYDYALLKLEKTIFLDEYTPLTVLKIDETVEVEICGYSSNPNGYYQF